VAAYNPLDNSEAEIQKATRLNAELRLNYLMANSDISEETRICYAITLLNRSRNLIDRLGPGSHESKQVESDIKLLTSRLRGIQNEK
jgi:hypothetical protein